MYYFHVFFYNMKINNILFCVKCNIKFTRPAKFNKKKVRNIKEKKQLRKNILDSKLNLNLL
jgi:hypothetical protein